MQEIIINDTNLSDRDIHKVGNKVRAVLIRDNNILISHYGGVVLLPGGSIDKNETKEDAIIRELEEETGITYNIDELEELLTIKYYQPNYPTRDNTVINRLMITSYYLANYKGINLNNIRRTDKEIQGNFNLELIPIEDLLKGEVSDNPRREYFDRELREVSKVLKRTR